MNRARLPILVFGLGDNIEQEERTTFRNSMQSGERLSWFMSKLLRRAFVVFSQKMPASRLVIALAAFGLSLACLVKSTGALPLSRPVPSPHTVIRIAAERWSPAIEQVWISYHVAMFEGVSFREQHLHQEALAALLMNNAGELPSVRPCGLKVQFLDTFGDFAIGASHLNPARRLDCLRGAVDYLLRQPISESDFVATRKDEAYWRRMGYSTYTYAQPLALLSIYQKYSPLYQIHSVGSKDLSDLSFDEFDPWLRRIRERKLITFDGKAALLDSLNLPVPDPMVLRPMPSLKSPRVPAGVLFFGGEQIGVSALVMVSLEPNDPNPVDRQIADRLSCNPHGPSHHGAASAGNAISGVFCEISDWYGDAWLGLAVKKADGVSYQDFCRQVQELTKDADVAAAVRGSPEGSKGLYVLLPPACEILQ
jgi:hypothetical protein